MKFKKYSLLFASYILFPLAAIELFSQLRFSTGYAYRVFSGNDYASSEIREHGFHFPHSQLIMEYKTIYPNHSETKFVEFNTDEFGTIEPSSLHLSKQRIDESVLFCGGSTTECIAVEKGKRVPDVFSSISKIPSINAGKSGKNLEGCIKSIDFVLSNIGKPRKIVVANNVNTLLQFARSKSGLPPLNINKKAASLPQGIVKKSFKAVFPGLYRSLAQINFKNIKASAKRHPSPGGLPGHEISLQQGCCYGASRFNKTKDSPRFDWDSNQSLQDYYVFVSEQGKGLIDMLARHNYPLENSIIFMEPNSFLNTRTSGLHDFRQFLSSSDGRPLNASQSAEIIANYDNEYQRALKKLGFKVLEIDSMHLRDEYFYDAVHLSPIGSEFIGKFYAKHVK